MTRLLGALAGLVVGLGLTWLCLFVLSNADLPTSASTGGCADAEHCDSRWWIGPAHVALLLLPAMAFAWAGCVGAARRWTARRVLVTFGLLAVATAAAAVAMFVS